MKSKILSLLLLCSLCLSSISFSFAQQENNIDSTDLIDATLLKKIEENCEAYLLADDGTRVELEVEVVEAKSVPIPVSPMFKNSMIPLTTNTVKLTTKTKDKDEFGILASGSLTLTWDDVKGIKNVIKNMSGFWHIEKGTFISGKIYWGSSYTNPINAPYNRWVSQYFDEDINYTSTSSTGQLKTYSTAYIKSPDDGREYQLTINNTPSIFD